LGLVAREPALPADPAPLLDRVCAPLLLLGCEGAFDDGATRLCWTSGAELVDPPDERSPPPPEFDDPDDPPPDGGDEGGLDRGTACAAAQSGAASARATTAHHRKRVGLAINACPSQAPRRRPSHCQ
jgi:hypothetical protein